MIGLSRRGFVALACGLLVPEPARALRTYAFAPAGGWFDSRGIFGYVTSIARGIIEVQLTPLVGRPSVGRIALNRADLMGFEVGDMIRIS